MAGCSLYRSNALATAECPQRENRITMYLPSENVFRSVLTLAVLGGTEAPPEICHADIRMLRNNIKCSKIQQTWSKTIHIAKSILQNITEPSSHLSLQTAQTRKERKRSKTEKSRRLGASRAFISCTGSQPYSTVPSAVSCTGQLIIQLHAPFASQRKELSLASAREFDNTVSWELTTKEENIA